MTSESKSSLIICIGVGAISSFFGFWHLERRFGSPPQIQAVAEGTVFSSLPHYQWSSVPLTLVLALKVGCPHCENELPFYEKLVRQNDALSSHVSVIAVFPDSAETVESAYPNRLLRIRRITDTDLQFLNVTGTPTLLLVDSAGRVKRVWKGELDEESRNAVAEAIIRGVN